MAAMKNLSLEQLGSLGAFTPQHAITPTQQSLLITWNKVLEEDNLPCERRVLDVYYDPRNGRVMIEVFMRSQQECVVLYAADEPPF